MSTAFASLFGGGTTSAADTSSTTSQIAGLNSTFSGMKGGLTTSLTAANTLAPDLKDVVDTSSITDAMDQTTKLQELCKGLSTDDCAKKQAQLQADTDAAQLKFFNDTLAASIQQLTDARVPIKAKLGEIYTEKSKVSVFKGEAVIPQFEELLSRLDGDIVVLKASVPYINPPESTSVLGDTSGSSGSSGSAAATRPEYTLPVTGTKSSYETEYDVLRLNYNSLMGIASTPTDINNAIYKWFRRTFIPIAFYMSLAYAAIIGGIACSNIFVNEKSLYIRLYYFIYGMLGFPAVLAYSALYTPFWNSVIPVYPRLSMPETSGHPDLVEVVKGVKSPTVAGIEAPAGMMWIKKSLSAEFFSYLISLDAVKKEVSALPAAPDGLEWFAGAAVAGQQLWSLKEKPATA